MSFRPPLLVLFLATFVLAACSSSPVSRIDANREAYESWPIEVREAILAERAEKGMTPEQVEMALGKPSEVISRSSRSGQDEVWVYRKGGGGGLLKNTGVSIGGGLGGVSVGGIGGGGSTVVDEREVVFRDGVVVRADEAP